MFTFFQAASPKNLKVPTIASGPHCTSCNLLSNCKFSKQRTSRQGKKVLLVDGPGADSPMGLHHQPSVSAALRSVLRDIDEYTIIGAQACPGDLSTNVQPWEHCQPLMIEQIQAINPETILVYGRAALSSIVQWLWGHNAELPDRWYGQHIPSRRLNAWVMPVGHAGRKLNADVSNVFHYRWLKAACEKQGRPYDIVPEYHVEILHDATTIVQALGAASRSKLSAFDYETNSLKPERSRARIYTASVAWLEGTKSRCIAFDMTTGVEEAWKQYLVSESRKIAANMKFELRWSRCKLGVEVQHLLWDTMINAHLADPQPTITGLKFQAFARLGLGYYAGEVEKHFDNSDEAGYNNIHLADREELLLYNGIDALAELDLGILQMYEAGRYQHLWSDTLPKKEFYTFGELS